ncbi:MAG TPA: PH domain-containing protein [Candidatus Binatia bacterium]|nr:PH domain-containing protein [Candidatus Binatia bacterium]
MAPPLLSGETPISTQRQHPAVLVPAGVIAALCIAVPLLLIHLVPARIAGHDTGEAKLIASVVIAVVVALWFLLRVLQWRFQTYTLTSHRIVMSRGVISRVMESISLDRVQDIVVRRPIADRLIGSGSIEIDSAGRDGVEVLRLIPHPNRFYTQVLQAVEDHRRLSMGYPSPGTEPPGPAAPPTLPPTPYGMAGGGV